MSLAWFDFYGRLLNIPRCEVDALPMGEMLDMIACYQITKGAKEKEDADDMDMIPDID